MPSDLPKVTVRAFPGLTKQLYRETRIKKKPPSHLSDLKPIIVSQAFRDQMVQLLPDVQTDPAFARFVTVLLFWPHRDRKSDGVLIPRQLLANVEGKRFNEKYVALRFLERMRDMYLPDLGWSEHEFNSHKPGKYRHITTTGLPAILEEAARKELLAPIDSRAKGVLADTGKPVRLQERASIRESARAIARQAAEAVTHPGTRTLLEFLNSRKPHVFTKTVTRHFNEALALVPTLKNEESRKYALRLLRQIELQPVPFYYASRGEKTARIFASGILSLPRDVRQALTQEWTWYDLQSAQLAVVAARWGIPQLNPYLKASPDDEGVSIWDSLFEHMGPKAQALSKSRGSDYEEVKWVFKSAIYGIVYGQGKASTKRFQTKDELEEGDDERRQILESKLGESADVLGERLMQHPAVKALFRGRSKQQNAIKQGRRATDAFGQTAKVSPTANESSVLAQVAQAEEMYLLMPVIDLAKTTNDFQVVAWLHDGFAVKYADRTKEQRWEKRIMEAVSARAKERGVRTYLVKQ